MPANYERDQNSAGAAALTLLLGIALGAAALLYATPQGKRFLEQFAGRAEDWKAQAASTLAESREKVVSSVEAQVPPEQEGRLRENL
jgi:uncharacterized protein HemX